MSKPKRFDQDSPMCNLLEDLGIDFNRRDHASYKLKSNGFMDLTVETWIEGSVMKISVCHYGEMNGDLMRDPEMVFQLGIKSTIEIPEYFRNDYAGIEQEVYSIVKGQHMINPKLLEDLKEFTVIWSNNIKAQGHKLVVEDQTNV